MKQRFNHGNGGCDGVSPNFPLIGKAKPTATNIFFVFIITQSQQMSIKIFISLYIYNEI